MQPTHSKRQHCACTESEPRLLLARQEEALHSVLALRHRQKAVVRLGHAAVQGPRLNLLGVWELLLQHLTQLLNTTGCDVADPYGQP